MTSENFIYIIIAILIFVLLMTTKFFKTFLFNILLSIACIYIFNTLLKNMGLMLDINFFTGIFSGMFGIPGVICLYILKLLL